MNDPRLLSLFITIFVLLGGYNVYTGLKRLREARARGQGLSWYKQINLLTGIEYLLLSFVFTISLSITNNNFPSSLKGLIVPIYLVVLLSSAVMAGFVIRQALSNARRKGQGRSTSSQARNEPISRANEVTVNELTPKQRAAHLQQ